MTEDLITYTEEDLGNDVTVTAASVSGKSTSAYQTHLVYKDFGVDYFDRVHLKFDIRFGLCSGEPKGFALGFTNILSTAPNWGTVGSGDPPIKIFMFYTSSRYHNLELFAGYGVGQYDITPISNDTTYYCTLVRPAGGDAAEMRVYSDAARTALVDTLSISGLGTNKWRYFFAFSNWPEGTTEYMFGSVGNFQFGMIASGGAQIIGLELL